MSTLQERFEQAQADVKTLTSRPSNETLLTLYALFKQGTVGDAQGKRPGMLDLKGRAKYDAWAAQKGTSSEEAMEAYCGLVEKLLAG